MATMPRMRNSRIWGLVVAASLVICGVVVVGATVVIIVTSVGGALCATTIALSVGCRARVVPGGARVCPLPGLASCPIG
jgi:hypothetical protein